MNIKSYWFELIVGVWILISIWPMINYLSPIYNTLLHSTIASKLSATSSCEDKLVQHRIVDHFSDYHKTPTCSMSSLQVHKPTYPLCPATDTETLLRAMSGGGRIGNDAPYQPRGCDLRWFGTEEICDILSRFERITLVGDSMMRDIAIAFHVFLRKDLVHGAHQVWLGNPNGADCSCEGAWDDGRCHWYININTEQLFPDRKHLFACPAESTGWVKYQGMTGWPIEFDQLAGYMESLYPMKPPKPHAIIMGAGLWDDLETNKTKAWVQQVINATLAMSPWLMNHDQWNPRLFVTPSAAHGAKIPKFWAKQGNIALSLFELAMGSYVKDVHGIDHLGTYNMTIQTSSHDGTHAGMLPNLLKAMAILNWLNSLDVSKW